MNQNDFFDAGYKVFGLYGVDASGCCECGRADCMALYKHPRSSNWQHTPEWSDDQFETMHEMGQFETGYGVIVQGLLVVDVDARNGGVESYERLCKELSIDLSSAAGLVVATGSGNGSLHVYFKLEKSQSLAQSLPQYPGIDFKTSGFVVGAGSMHKSGNTYEVISGHPDNITSAPSALVELLKKPEQYRATTSMGSIDVSIDDVRAILSYVDADCDYDTWIRAGMAINHTLNGDGFDVWDDWSKQGKKYPGYPQLEKHWHSFGKSSTPVTLGTIIHYAEQNGYQQAVNVEFVSDFIDDEQPDLLDTSGIDLKRPPGFVGELTKWINSQCRYPRESLSVAAALTAVGNIGGLRYQDGRDNMSANLMSFCVAGSSTGKEAVQQALADCLKAAGVASAVHGAIKSEQEILRNLTRNQAAFYVIDEMGIVLKKILNSGAKSGASYLEGVVGTIMSTYSKATSFLPVGGDLKEGIKTDLKNELSAAMKIIDNNEDRNGIAKRRADQITRQLANIDQGLERPFLSLIGFTTPVTFNGLVDFENATNGFLSRAMIFDEPETNPKIKHNHKVPPLPDSLMCQLANLWRPGEFSVIEDTRVEYYGERSQIQTRKDASEALDGVLDYFWRMAEDAKENGLEAIPRRGYELCAKVSFILAIPEGVRTVEHVRWAFALAKSDINRKMRLAYANMEEKESPANSIGAKIQSILSDSENQITRGVLVNRCRPAKKPDVEKVIDELVSTGRIKEHLSERNAKKYTI